MSGASSSQFAAVAGDEGGRVCPLALCGKEPAQDPPGTEMGSCGAFLFSFVSLVPSRLACWSTA